MYLPERELEAGELYPPPPLEALGKPPTEAPEHPQTPRTIVSRAVRPRFPRRDAFISGFSMSNSEWIRLLPVQGGV